MAKKGKGRKGGGGGAGPKQRKYERDNNGRFASTGSGGATARGGRLLTAKGNKRTTRALAGKTKTIEAKGQKGVLAKPKGLKPGSIKPKAAAATKPVAKKSRFTPSESAERKQRATELKAIPKKTRQAERIGRVARRQIEKSGGVGVGIIGKGKPSSQQYSNSLAEGALRLKRDKNGTVGKSMQNTANKLRGRMATIGVSPRTGAAGGAKVKRITAAKPKSVINKAKPKAVAAKPATRKEQLAAGAKKRTAQADRIDAKIKKLESEYRGKDAAFYTQGVKPAGRDRMIAKSQKAAQLREESASLRTKAANAERMSSKIKDKPIKSSGGNKRLDRAIKNEAAGSTSYKRNPKGYQKRITALTAQKVYQTGDFMSGLSLAQSYGKGFRLPRNQRAAAAKPAAPKAAKAPKGGMRATKRVPLAPDSATAKRLTMFKSGKQLTDQRTKSLREGLKKETDPVQKIKTSSSISESQLKSKSYGDDITRMQARPIMGKRTGIGRGDKPVSGPAAKRPNTIKGKPKRDAGVAAKVKPGINLNAKKYPAIYRDRANTKGKAAAKAAKRPMR